MISANWFSHLNHPLFYDNPEESPYQVKTLNLWCFKKHTYNKETTIMITDRFLNNFIQQLSLLSSFVINFIVVLTKYINVIKIHVSKVYSTNEELSCCLICVLWTSFRINNFF